MNSYYSNIYWHFTGSPKGLDWEKIYCPKDILKYGKPKEEAECVSILAKIFRSKNLLARAKEKIDTHIYSDPFCCVTDIPIQNLQNHKMFYGNVAIGFKPDNIHKLFNPVIYLSKKLLPIRSKKYEELSENEKGAFAKHRLKGQSMVKKQFSLERLKDGSSIDEDQPGSFLFHHFKITEFSENADNSFYREREWRKLGDFQFELNDIAAIIVSEESLKKVQKIFMDNKITDVPVFTWEILDRM